MIHKKNEPVFKEVMEFSFVEISKDAENLSDKIIHSEEICGYGPSIENLKGGFDIKKHIAETAKDRHLPSCEVFVNVTYSQLGTDEEYEDSDEILFYYDKTTGEVQSEFDIEEGKEL